MQILHIVIMILVRRVEHHVEVAASDAGLVHAAHLNREPLDRQTRQDLAHGALRPRRVLRHVNQSGDEHIPRNARLTVQPKRRTRGGASIAHPVRPPIGDHAMPLSARVNYLGIFFGISAVFRPES